MAFQKLRDRIAEQFTKERLALTGRYLKRKALEFAGRVVLSRIRKGAKMKKYTLRLAVDVETSGRDVIEDAIGKATPDIYKYAPEALAFLNLNGSTRFCGFRSDISADKKHRGPKKRFSVQIDLFLEAESKAAVDEPVKAISGQVDQYAPVVLGLLGIADSVQLNGMSASVLKGHA